MLLHTIFFELEGHLYVIRLQQDCLVIASLDIGFVINPLTPLQLSFIPLLTNSSTLSETLHPHS
jgi:hypothetical protein